MSLLASPCLMAALGTGAYGPSGQRPEGSRFDALTLKAVWEGPDGPVAFFLDSQGRHLSAKAGQRLMDGVLTTVGWGGVTSRHETADASFEVRTREVTRPLFPSGLESKSLRPEPAPGSGKPTSPQPSRAQPSGRRYERSPLSLNLETDELVDVLALFAEVSGLNVMLQPGLERRVSYKGDRVPWDRALDEIVMAQGLGWRLEGNFLRIARSQELRGAAPAPTRYTGSPLTSDCRKGRLADVLPILAEAGGLKLVAPAVDGEVTFYCRSVPWDEILHAILRGRGLAFAVEGSTLRVYAAR